MVGLLYDRPRFESRPGTPYGDPSTKRQHSAVKNPEWASTIEIYVKRCTFVSIKISINQIEWHTATPKPLKRIMVILALSHFRRKSLIPSLQPRGIQRYVVYLG